MYAISLLASYSLNFYCVSDNDEIHSLFSSW